MDRIDSPQEFRLCGESVVATHRVAGKSSVLLSQIWSTVTAKIGTQKSSIQGAGMHMNKGGHGALWAGGLAHRMSMLGEIARLH